VGVLVERLGSAGSMMFVAWLASFEAARSPATLIPLVSQPSPDLERAGTLAGKLLWGGLSRRADLPTVRESL